MCDVTLRNGVSVSVRVVWDIRGAREAVECAKVDRFERGKLQSTGETQANEMVLVLLHSTISPSN